MMKRNLFTVITTEKKRLWKVQKGKRVCHYCNNQVSRLFHRCSAAWILKPDKDRRMGLRRKFKDNELSF